MAVVIHYYSDNCWLLDRSVSGYRLLTDEAVEGAARMRGLDVLVLEAILYCDTPTVRLNRRVQRESVRMSCQ